ncbi:transporter substrate-binding domain-containing protein [Anaerotignum sp.]|uniref:transporter substrate-binding domain-containing protein n=1 Tax=Anaerotignum sp. TaxID=2039241 RepID=UPI0028A0957E|nr:transporter substrate-binding domain-containing protein [Anaerotignum sp.]
MNLLRKIGIIAMSITMAMGLFACGNKVTISIDNKDDTPKTKKYKIATNISAPPFEYKNFLDDYIGIDVDLLEWIAEDQGFEYEFVPMTINEVYQALDAGEVDGALARIFITEERKERYDFSEPYLGSGIAMAVNPSRTDINSYEDLAGKRAAVTRGTIEETFAESIKDKYGFKIVSFDEYTGTYKDVLKDGTSQVLFENDIVIDFIISQGYELRAVSQIIPKSFYGFAVPKGKNPELLEMFNKGLAEAKKSGEYQKILGTYGIDN